MYHLSTREVSLIYSNFLPTHVLSLLCFFYCNYNSIFNFDLVVSHGIFIQEFPTHSSLLSFPTLYLPYFSDAALTITPIFFLLSPGNLSLWNIITACFSQRNIVFSPVSECLHRPVFLNNFLPVDAFDYYFTLPDPNKHSMF